LRTPLNGVLGMSELLKLSTLNAEQEGYADSIRVCADTLLVTINDLLDYSKLEAGKLKLLSIPLRLKSTIMEIVQALKYTNTKAELETIVELELKDDLMVLGDPQRIHQIFLNLVSNSYKFSYDKGSVVVRARAERENEKGIRVVCSVTDSGIGISEEQLSRLFTPFEQADTSTQRSYGGSGLGLSICKALLQILGGRIWIESQPGSGTTVFFSVDFQKAATDSVVLKTPVAAREPGSMDDAAKAPIVERPVIDLSAIPRDQLRVAIAEDNPINQKIAMSFVGKLGFKSEAFNDGRLAVEALRTQSKLGNPYHLVLMDCQMPVMDGYEATRLIRADADPAVSQVLVIAMTASAIRGDRERCLTAGMNDYLAKPVRAAVLEEKLEEYLQPKPNAINNLQASAQEEARQVIEKALLVGKTDGSIKAGTAGTKPRKKSV
jgi:CheY-like chemotaxis protein